MVAGAFHPNHILRGIANTDLFRQYCRTRGIPLDPACAGSDLPRWDEVLSSLPPGAKEQITRELEWVCALADADGNAHLLAAGKDVPGDDVPGGAALALWFMLNRPRDFEDVFFHHAAAERSAWHTARGPAGQHIRTLVGRAPALRDALREVFHKNGCGRFGVVDAHATPDGARFVARLADRVHLVEGFTAEGVLAPHSFRPAITICFAYDPVDGAILLRCPPQSADRARELLKCFGRTILHAAIVLDETHFALDLLKYPLPLAPDAPDMLLARVRALQLRYPARLGRRILRFETLGDDDPDAIVHLLRAHAGNLEQLTVTHAELQVRLLFGKRTKDVSIRLWRDGSDLAWTPLGNRLRQCLKQWGLCHG